jgi:hypothetical protein
VVLRHGEIDILLEQEFPDELKLVTKEMDAKKEE